jgi:long-chain acyl-CoA synthetase
LEAGERVAVISTTNRSEWNLCDQAILQAGGIDVPMYPSISAQESAFILNDSGSVYCFVSDAALVEKIQSIAHEVPSLRGIYCFEPVSGVQTVADVIALGEQAASDVDDLLQARMDAVKELDLATLIYTSGTTGTPKGVMLSHRNIASNTIASRERLPVGPDATSVSFLPLCHSYERMLVYLYLYTGVGVYYAENMETIGDNIREVKPDVFTAVPRLLEKVYDRIMDKGKALTGAKRLLFFWAVELAEEFDLYGKSPWYKARLAVARKLIFSKWQEALGGNVKTIASGSAALNPRLARIFAAAGLSIQEGYGLTETSPVISVNLPVNGGMKLGTVGPVISGVEVKLADDGEIWAKGPNLMMGYYNRPDLTAEVITPDGWFKTGDIGVIDADGHLRITDRKKEIFKTSGGKYIAPQHMENVFKESPFIEQCMVAGENQKHPVLLVQPDFAFLRSYCDRKGLPFGSPAEAVQIPQVVARIQKDVDRINTQFGQWEQVKKIYLCPEQWTIADGQLTPTLKLKRKAILTRYEAAYSGLYA